MICLCRWQRKEGRIASELAVIYRHTFEIWKLTFGKVATPQIPLARFRVPGTAYIQRIITCTPCLDINYIMSGHNVWFYIKAFYRPNTVGHPLARALLEYPVTYNYTRLFTPTTVLDKSGHDCGKFNHIKCDRIPTQRSIQKLFISN